MADHENASGRDAIYGNKRILILIHRLSVGGAERSAVNLAHSLCQSGARVTLATTELPGNGDYSLNQQVTRIDLNLGKSDERNRIGLIYRFRQLWRTRKLIRREMPDVVISFLPIQSVIALIANLGLRNKVLVLERSYPPNTRIGPTWHILRKMTYGLAETVIAQTQDTADWILQHTYASRTSVIPNFVVWPSVAEFPVVLIEQHVQPDAKVVLAAGTDRKIKGFELLIKAFADVVESKTEWVLVIAGPENGDNYAGLTEIYGIRDRVIFPGRVGNIGDWYERADIFVLSSLTEGFPNVLLEAMAAGCCVVAFDCNVGPRDIIRDNIDGILVPPADDAALTQVLKELVCDAKRRGELALKAEEVKVRFGRESVLKQWEKVL